MTIQKYLKMKSETINKILDIAKLYPTRTAYSIDGNSISYSELINRAKELANILSTYNEKNVILYGNKEFYMSIGIIACLLSNKTYVPIDYYCPIERIKNIVKSLDEYIIISKTRIEGFDKQYSIEDIKTKRLVIDNTLNPICYIIYTSGSGGAPKGVPINITNLDNFTSWISSIYPLNTYENCIILNQSSFSFDLSVADFYYSLCNGHSIVAYNNCNDSLSYKYDILSKYKINIVFATPSFIRMLLLNKDFNDNNYTSLKCIYFCGERLNKKLVIELFNRFRNISIINAYGPTEATSAVSACLIEKEMIDKYSFLPCGVIKNAACNIEIVNNEIVLSGKSVFTNYLGEEKRIKDYRTGDLGEIKDGYLFCNGRKDNQIKYSGYRIELEEIEEVINNILDVEISVVCPNYNSENEIVSLTAYVKRTNSKLTEEIIRNHLKTFLPQYMIPSNIVFVKEISLNMNGKVQRGIDYDRCKNIT